ncbi:MAG: ABC transporter ATP-binding protein [Acidimicrobiales bacterium]|jgi:ABC-2 type transport system ATP-binding protein|nr:ABC transporter ATP-binding protein [Acidimicrobiales bacterium]
MGAVIEVEGLRKAYRSRRRTRMAVDGLDLAVPEGGVFGFLGPNGSGKTTTIRCLLGLIRPTSGSCRLLGDEVPRGLPRVLGRVGAIVETPALFPAFSGRRNLEVLARTEGIGPAAVDAVLARVGLAERADDAVKGYSLGMRQRLGLAAALLKDPALVILDEPANGLDPAGIVEVRQLLRALAAEGRTVFVSSHILVEVQQTCDQVAILARGRCVAAGPVDEVLQTGRSTGVLVALDGTGNTAAAREVLAAAGLPAEPAGEGLRVGIDASRAADITRALAARDLWVRDLRPEEVSLESVFLELTADTPAPPPAAPSALGPGGA